MTPLDITRLLQVGAAISAVALAWRSSHHRPFAAFLVAETLANAARAVIAARWPAMFTATGEALEGAERAAFLAHTSLSLLWPIGFMALAAWLCLRRRGLGLALAIVAWLALSAFVAWRYPELRGDALRRYFLAVDLLAMCISFAMLLSQWLYEEESAWTTSHLCLILTLFVELAVLIAGPYRFGLYGAAWTLAQLGYSTLYAALIAVQGAVIWSLQRRR